MTQAAFQARVGGRGRAAEELRRSEDRFHMLVSSIEDYAIFMLDPNGVIQTWNEGVRRLKGYNEQEIVGKHFSVFYTPEDRADGLPERVLDQATKNGRFEAEGWRVRKDGTRFWANVVITALYDKKGVLIGFGKVTRDLTERRQLEEQRYQLLREQEARLSAERSVQIRDEFISIAAHELKTPVTSLRLQAQMIIRRLQRTGTVDPQLVASALGIVDQQSGKLSHLVNELLDFSRVANGRLTLDRSETDLVELVVGVIERMQPDAPNVRFEVTAPRTLLWSVDALRIEQVVTNLVDNAIKYAPGLIQIGVAQVNAGHARIQVRDHGPGVPPERRDSIFTRYFQADARSHRSGLGLGLYISQQVVVQHGGEIRADFPPDGGSLFTVILPLEQPPIVA